jgi:hypothetical protein
LNSFHLKTLYNKNSRNLRDEKFLDKQNNFRDFAFRPQFETKVYPVFRALTYRYLPYINQKNSEKNIFQDLLKTRPEKINNDVKEKHSQSLSLAYFSVMTVVLSACL